MRLSKSCCPMDLDLCTEKDRRIVPSAHRVARALQPPPPPPAPAPRRDERGEEQDQRKWLPVSRVRSPTEVRCACCADPPHPVAFPTLLAPRPVITAPVGRTQRRTHSLNSRPVLAALAQSSPAPVSECESSESASLWQSPDTCASACSVVIEDVVRALLAGVECAAERSLEKYVERYSARFMWRVQGRGR